MNPKTNQTSTSFIFAAVLGLLFTATLASAQNSILAIGQISNSGTVINSATTLGAGATLDSVKNGTGDYTITIDATDAFTGAGSSDFLVEITVESSSSNDDVAKAHPDLINADQLEIQVRTDDLEDDSNPNIGEARDISFFFAIYRIPTAYPDQGATKYLQAIGNVSSGGAFLQGVGIDGIEVDSSSNGVGNHLVTLTKPGAFAGDSADDYVVILSLRGADDQDQTIRGDVTSVASDDQVVINVHTDDVQSAIDDNTVTPEGEPFCFNVYRIPPGPGLGLAASRLLIAMASVNGNNGNLFAGDQAFDGGLVTSVRNGEGDYRVTINSPGRFAGKGMNDIVTQVHLNQSSSADEFIMSRVFVADADTLHVDVHTNDLETDGQGMGVPYDANFFLFVYDAEAVIQPDLRIGTKKNLTQQVGDDIYNGGGAFQKVNVGLSSTAKRKYWLTLENDGNVSDDVFLKAKRSGNKIKAKYFRITGGRENVTAEITSGAYVVDNVRPGKLIRYEAQAKYKKPGQRPARTLRFLARSEFVPSRRDANKAKLVPK